MRYSNGRWFLVVLVAALGCSSDGGGDGDGEPQCVAPAPLATPSVAAAVDALDGLGFDGFVDVSYEQLLLRFPETVSSLALSAELGIRDDQLTPVSDDYEIQTDALVDAIDTRLAAFDRASLTPAQRITFDVYTWYLDDWLAAGAFRFHDYPVTQALNALHKQLVRFMTDLHPLADRVSAEDYIARLRQVPLKIDQVVARIAARREVGIVPPQILLQWSLPEIEGWAAAAPRSSPLYSAFAERLQLVDSLDSTDRDELLAVAETAVECHVLPAFARLRDAVSELIADAPADIGVSTLPLGGEFYAYALRHHTTTELSADEVHALGLAEIERIHAEIRTHLAALGYPEGETIPAAFSRVVVDGGLVPEGSVVRVYEDIIAAADARVDAAFESTPEAEVIVIGGDTGGFYIAPAPDGSRPGAFYARVGGQEPRYAMPTLTYHEAIPGHHFQIALSQQLDLPMFRRQSRFTSYVEGWALYAERLAFDLGWYDDDPYGDLGRLQAEAFRAARLVVDTGIHARGWSFEMAVDYMVDNVGYSRRGMEGQIARYAARPGQATAYKVGMNELLELRDRTATALGASYDVRAFHSVVLGQGAVPLAILEQIVDSYIASAPLQR